MGGINFVFYLTRLSKILFQHLINTENFEKFYLFFFFFPQLSLWNTHCVLHLQHRPIQASPISRTRPFVARSDCTGQCRLEGVYWMVGWGLARKCSCETGNSWKEKASVSTGEGAAMRPLRGQLGFFLFCNHFTWIGAKHELVHSTSHRLSDCSMPGVVQVLVVQ